MIEMTPKRNPEQYEKSDWIERDNFETEEQARGYVSYLSRNYSRTPYRIVRRKYDGIARFAVMFVPEWNLR